MKMKTRKHPVRNTILYGLVCGLSFTPLSLMLNALLPWPQAFCLTLWLYLAGYALLLNLWGNKIHISTAFPLLLLLAVIFLVDSIALFFILALMVAGWIRSGICYQKTGVKGIGVELVLCFSGSLLVLIFTPGSVYAWALGVWLFFLVQALYFVFFEHPANRRDTSEQGDAFEKASRQAEAILAGNLP